jgi:ribosomal protein L29
MGTIAYEQDLVAWANEQARLLRAGRFDQLDLEHLAEEIEDVGKSEQRELANRMAILLAHLLKWQMQPERRGSSWTITIRNQRRAIARALEETPSLKGKLADARWWDAVWGDAADLAAREAGLSEFAENCPWTVDEVMDLEWMP